MSLLLDTHVWLWADSQLDRLADPIARAIVDPQTEVYLSAASIWEMAIKRRLGKLPLPEPVATYVERRREQSGFKVLAISHHHAAGVESLEVLHRDPFDRLLIVQARIEGHRLVTVDDHVLQYPGDIVDARMGKSRS